MLKQHLIKMAKTEILWKDYQYDKDMVMVNPGFPRSSLDKIKETEFDDNDIIIATYPKCGK